jgi:hypothetical protein
MRLWKFWLKNFFRNNNFAKVHNNNVKRQGNSFKPELFSLEDRITPTTYPGASILSQNHNLVILAKDLVDLVPKQELTNACVVTLDPAKDVIHQISSELANRSGIETLRIISHAEPGILHFGNQVIDKGVLTARGAEVSSWGKALAQNADLLVYGCRVAETITGQDFVNTLSDLTGADVAASVDATGMGGNTSLEFAVGVVESELQASAQEWKEAKLQLPQSGDFTYSSNGSSITITGYTGAGGAVSIPSFIIPFGISQELPALPSLVL